MTTMTRRAPLPGRDHPRSALFQGEVADFAGGTFAPPDDLHFERAFTLAEVAERTKMSPRQVQAHIDDGSLVAVNVGRGDVRQRLRVLDEDLEGFMRRRRTGAVPDIPTAKGARRRKEAEAPKESGFLERRAARLREGRV